jgi:hypothetical protein
LLKKDWDVHWADPEKQAFEGIKHTISSVPVLVSPNYSKEFWIFSYSSEHTIAAAMLQKNSGDFKQPIAFMCIALKGHELDYTAMEKHAYASVKTLKHFREYVWSLKVIAYIPHSAVKTF